jgi:hypothetical protein
MLLQINQKHLPKIIKIQDLQAILQIVTITTIIIVSKRTSLEWVPR